MYHRFGLYEGFDAETYHFDAKREQFDAKGDDSMASRQKMLEDRSELYYTSDDLMEKFAFSRQSANLMMKLAGGSKLPGGWRLSDRKLQIYIDKCMSRPDWLNKTRIRPYQIDRRRKRKEATP